MRARSSQFPRLSPGPHWPPGWRRRHTVNIFINVLEKEANATDASLVAVARLSEATVPAKCAVISGRSLPG